MRTTRKLAKLIDDPNFNCNNMNDVISKIDLCINDLDLLRKRESDYYKGIALLKRKINLIQNYLFDNGIISELQNKYLNRFDSEIKLLFLQNAIIEYRKWLFDNGKNHSEIYKVMEILNKELKIINFKTENYKKQIDNEKPSLQQEQKQYSLLCKQKRKLERRNKRKR